MRLIFASLVPAALLALSPQAALAAHHENKGEATAPHYSTAETPLGTLMDDPAAKAVLEKHVPMLIANQQVQMARSITLKDIQGFAPDALKDETLAAIDADLAKLPRK